MSKTSKFINTHKVGAKEDYTPWIKTTDIPGGHGNKKRVKSMTCNRIHHCLSNLEYGVLMLADFCDNVVDIREQFPLRNHKLAQKIANELGVKYPRNTESSEKEPVIMTTDFLLTLKDENGSIRYVARTVKPAEHLNDINEQRRILEKFEIERRYWEAHEISFKIYTEESINSVMVRNIAKCHKYHKNEILKQAFGRCKSDLIKALEIFEMYEGGQLEYDKLSKSLNISKGIARSLVYHLIMHKIVRIDMTQNMKTRGIDNFDFDSAMFVKHLEDRKHVYASYKSE